LGLVGPHFSEDSVRQDLCSRPAWRQATFQEEKRNIKEIEALELWGTPFQIKVWETLYNLPRHQTITYKEVAYQAGYPTAFQAIGQAISRNPISLLIPCHLVVKKSGEIGDYYWGKSLKEELLKRPSLENFL
jgi:AraC family transcriptional regulator of adaptative response/methylated-DNA-[protein]-cysteine methyltransferase